MRGGEGDSEAIYLMRGSVLSLSFVEPHKQDRPEKPEEPAPRHSFHLLLISGSARLLMHVDHLQVEDEGLTGQRMVEIEEHCVIFDLCDDGLNVATS